MKTLNIHSRIIILLALISLLSLGANAPAVAPYTADHVVFAVIGDYGSAGQAEADVAKLVKSWQPDFIVTVGDNNYPDGALYSIDQNIGQYYHDYIYKYVGKYGSGSATRRFFPALGNHDWHNGSANPYLNYFSLPGNERYYDFTYGPIHFFVLDSMKEEVDGNTATSPQAKWLKNALALSASSFNVVVSHYAPYSSGEHGEVPFMQWPFKEWGADVVLAGHDHDYERLLVNGMPYFVDGLGGDELGQFRPTILSQSQIHYNQNFGALRVEATTTSMKFQFYARDNTLIDEYVLGDNVTSTATPIPTIIPTATFTPTPTVIPSSAPVLISPPNGATLSTRFIFTWNKVSIATRYQIMIDNNSTFASPEWNTLVSTNSYQVASMPRRTTYYWRVRAKNSLGVWTPWSAIFKLIVP